MIAAKLSFVALVLLALAGRAGAALGKYAELASHFRIQYLLATVVCALVFLFYGARLWALAAALFAALLLATLSRWYLPAKGGRARGAGGASSSRLVLLLYNANYLNTRYADFISLVERERPDIFILQEATAGWLAALRALSHAYPHTEARPSDSDGSGIAIFSRAEFEELRVVEVGDPARASFLARLRANEAALSLFTTHPPAPIRRGNFRARNRQLMESARFVRDLAGPKVFVGDLNTSLWSPYFGRLKRAAGLRDAREGFGVLPSWPTWNRLRLLMLPIDHCFVSREVAVRRIETGPDIGSDHLPLIVELEIASAETKRRL